MAFGLSPFLLVVGGRWSGRACQEWSVESEEWSGGAAHKLRSAASLESQLAHPLLHS